jgi:CRP-like cAMP-binding protein
VQIFSVEIADGAVYSYLHNLAAWGNTQEGLMENRLLASLARPDFALLVPYLKQVPLLQGAVLQEPKAPVELVCFPLSGAVSLCAVMKGGEAIEIASVGREGAVGLSIRPGPWHARSRAVVQVAGIAKAIPSQAIRAASAQSASIRDLIVTYEDSLSAQSRQLAACNALHSVEERLARWFLQLSDRIGSDELPVTQDTISQMLGVRRTTVTLVAQKFQQDGLISYRRARIHLVNPAGLRAIACECYDGREQDALLDQPDLKAG